MSRDKGFTRADVDVRLLDDRKVRQPVRSTADEGLVARCLVAYTSVVLASWSAGEPVTLEDAAPLWLTATEDLRDRLAFVGLLQSDGRIPEHAWANWFGEAWTRREKGRDRWRRWNQRSQSDPSVGTDSQSVQTVQTSPQRLANVGERTDGPWGSVSHGLA